MCPEFTEPPVSRPRRSRGLAAAVLLALSVPLAPREALAGPQPDGAPCMSPSDCTSGFCTDGVCCDSACNGSPCTACSKAAGAAADGTCASFTGTPCDDHNPCTQTDTCQNGVCLGAKPVVCPAPDACHDAVCDPQSDGGACLSVPKVDGAPCDDGNVCTQTDTCQSGTCTGANPVVCKAQDVCHAAGVCDPATGCSNPPAPCGGAPAAPLANGQLCVVAGQCASGFCTRGVCCDSACTDLCHSCALAVSPGTCAREPAGVDLDHQCSPEGSCLSTCGPEGLCIGSGPGTQCAAARCIDEHRLLGAALCSSMGSACPTDASVLFDCAPYRCQAALGTCAPHTCQSVEDCAPGFACDQGHHCARAPDVAGGDDGGCRSAPGLPHGGMGWWALGLVTALVLRRRSGYRR
jgi:hypothetical protein